MDMIMQDCLSLYNKKSRVTVLSSKLVLLFTKYSI
jgi:hypothetical protein